MNADFLKQLLVAFNEHDIDGIMDFFTDDCTLDMPRGTDPWGTRYVNRDQVRLAFTNRFNSIPDVHYSDDRHWVAGNRGVSEWTLTGTWSSPTTQNILPPIENTRSCSHLMSSVTEGRLLQSC
ncbi:MAG: nuclear transport factor 2 family protein [Chitinophagaceae bacterium]|nr:MAG: nuclear transport factor 2 family protein [Chitinophagaceae bacterium]